MTVRPVQLAFAAALLARPWWASLEGQKLSGPLLYLGLAILALSQLQRVPLPPGLWQALLGSELQVASLSEIGTKDSWRPLTVTPPQTLAAFLVLVPTFGTTWAVSTLS